MNRRRIGICTAALVVAGLVLSRAVVVPAQAQAPATAADLTTQITRLQRDVRDLQAEIFRISGGTAGVAVGATPPPPADLAPPQDDAVRQRVGDIEESLRQLTGRMEELGHQIDLLAQKNERMQKQLDFMASNPPAAAAGQPATPAPPDSAVASAAQTRPTQAPPVLAPATGSLGTVPAGTPLPQPGANPKADFDAAMGLLTRAQYDRARQAFRAFADAHPDTDLGAQALFWTGDIAYSTQKDYESAAHDYAELLKKYPTAERAPEAMLKLGLSLLSLGQKKEGCVALAALPKTYTLAPPAIVTRAKAEAKNAACG